MSCSELVELVTEYLEGALSSEDRERFDAHLGECGACSEYLDQMRLTVRLMGRLGADSEVDPEIRSRLIKTFRKARSS